MRRIDRIHAEDLGNVQRLLNFLLQEIGAEMAARHDQAILVEFSTKALQPGIVEIGIDTAEALDFGIT